jgi:hypothetical protein
MKITSYCRLNNQLLDIDGNIQRFESNKIDVIFNELYRGSSIDYPRFFKMDDLSKLGMLGIELLSQKIDGFDSYADDEIAMVFMNVDSSLETDVKHQKMLDEKRNTSPAVFVYTLPNIVMGEIAIRKEWFGENLFILAPDFNLENWLKEVQLMFTTKKAKAVVGGWINVFQGQFDLRLFFVENETKAKGFDSNSLKLL